MSASYYTHGAKFEVTYTRISKLQLYFHTSYDKNEIDEFKY